MPALVKQRASILFVLLLAVTGAIAGPAAGGGGAPAATERLQALDHEILVRLNETRTAHGLRPLVLSGDLQGAAVTHSRAMLEGGFFAHESKDGSSFVARVKRHYSASGSTAWSAGENLLYSTDAVDAAAAIEAWLASPAHRKNMLTPEWREVGIGSVHAASAGGTFGGEPTWVITMDFGTRTGSIGNIKPASPQATTKSKPRPRSKPKSAKLAAFQKPARRQKIERVLPAPTHSEAAADEAVPSAGDDTLDSIPPDQPGDDGEQNENGDADESGDVDEDDDSSPLAP
jgi:uncharacterized protein YkwD